MREASRYAASSPTAERLWTVAALAQFLGLHPKTIYTWVERGSVPHFKIGGRVRFHPTEIERWLKTRRGGV